MGSGGIPDGEGKEAGREKGQGEMQEGIVGYT